MTNKKDSLGDRMKCYEAVPKNFLTRRTPVIIRNDGKAFHTFTRGFQKPFDPVMVKTMQDTMKYLCENIQGCVLGYTQSDEITLVLCDYQTLTTSAWFDYNVQKITSICASMCTLAFNKFYYQNQGEYINNLIDEDIEKIKDLNIAQWIKIYADKNYKALFDSRAFNVPKEEVTNCLIWRQQDATRNSILSVGQYYFSHKELLRKSCNEIQDMLFVQKGVNWNDYCTTYKRGSCCIKVPKVIQKTDGKIIQTITREKWEIDNEIPIFSQDREYIESRIRFE